MLGFFVFLFFFVFFWRGWGGRKGKIPEEIKFSSWGYAELFGEGVLTLRWHFAFGAGDWNRSWALSTRSLIVFFSHDLLWTLAAEIRVEDKSKAWYLRVRFSPSLGTQLHEHMVKCFTFWTKCRNSKWHVSLSSATARWCYYPLYLICHLWKETTCRGFLSSFQLRRKCKNLPCYTDTG